MIVKSQQQNRIACESVHTRHHRLAHAAGDGGLGVVVAGGLVASPGGPVATATPATGPTASCSRTGPRACVCGIKKENSKQLTLCCC